MLVFVGGAWTHRACASHTPWLLSSAQRHALRVESSGALDLERAGLIMMPEPRVALLLGVGFASCIINTRDSTVHTLSSFALSRIRSRDARMPLPRCGTHTRAHRTTQIIGMGMSAGPALETGLTNRPALTKAHTLTLSLACCVWCASCHLKTREEPTAVRVSRHSPRHVQRP